MPQIKITKKKDGREVASFRSVSIRGGILRNDRIRTSTADVNWTRAEQIKELLEYGIQLQLDQAAKGLGSDGTAMPPPKSRRAFVERRNGVARFETRTKSIRNLYGPGKDGHMLDDIRINYLDDKKGTFAITRRSSRIKARANEQKAPWWGWSPESVRKLTARAGEIFPQGVAERLFSMGLIGANAVASANKRTFFARKVA